MSNLNLESLQETVAFLSRRLNAGELDKTIWLELPVRGFEEKLTELYEQFQRGECSLGYIAEQLGITTWELYELLERRGLRTTNL